MKDFKKLLIWQKGKDNELETVLLIMERLMLRENTLRDVLKMVDEEEKMLQSFILKLKG